MLFFVIKWDKRTWASYLRFRETVKFCTLLWFGYHSWLWENCVDLDICTAVAQQITAHHQSHGHCLDAGAQLSLHERPCCPSEASFTACWAKPYCFAFGRAFPEVAHPNQGVHGSLLVPLVSLCEMYLSLSSCLLHHVAGAGCNGGPAQM